MQKEEETKMNEETQETHKGKIYYKPQGAEGPFYNPGDSIIVNFPIALKLAVHLISDGEAGEGYKQFLYSQGATPKGLERAINFYDKYLETLLTHTAEEAPWDTFAACGLPHDDKSFLLFQSCVAGALMSLYHESLVAMGGEQMEWREHYMKNVKDFIQERMSNVCTNSAPT